MKKAAVILAIFCLPFALVNFSVRPVFAQAAAGITIIPPKFELFANPGDTITETIRVKNNSDTPQTYGIVIEDFSSAGEEGQVVLEEGETDTNFSLKKWIEPSTQNLVVQPNEETPFPFTINIPKDAEPGGHYASVLFQIGGPTVEGVTNVKQRVGALILLRISGNVVEKAQIDSFDAPKFSKKGPVIFTLRVKNDGTTHINPGGTIIVTDMFGKKVDELPLMSANVFPGSIRKMLTPWEKPGVLGQYTATLVATYGQQNLPLTAATKFTVVSPTAAILLLVAVVGGGLFLISVISGRRRLAKALKVMTKGD
jgi:hypothetical protein